MKAKRQAQILDIIESREIENQSQLISALKDAGVSSTQATVSRDIRELRLVKELTDRGSYKYVSPAKSEISNYEYRLRTIFREGVTSYSCAQNLVVIKTLPGLASAAGSAIDAMNIDGLVGSIAGDDTAFLAMRDNAAAEKFCAEINSLL